MLDHLIKSNRGGDDFFIRFVLNWLDKVPIWLELLQVFDELSHFLVFLLLSAVWAEVLDVLVKAEHVEFLLGQFGITEDVNPPSALVTLDHVLGVLCGFRLPEFKANSAVLLLTPLLLTWLTAGEVLVILELAVRGGFAAGGAFCACLTFPVLVYWERGDCTVHAVLVGGVVATHAVEDCALGAEAVVATRAVWAAPAPTCASHLSGAVHSLLVEVLPTPFAPQPR
jgi:hypothetical protein